MWCICAYRIGISYFRGFYLCILGWFVLIKVNWGASICAYCVDISYLWCICAYCIGISYFRGFYLCILGWFVLIKVNCGVFICVLGTYIYKKKYCLVYLTYNTTHCDFTNNGYVKELNFATYPRVTWYHINLFDTSILILS